MPTHKYWGNHFIFLQFRLLTYNVETPLDYEEERTNFLMGKNSEPSLLYTNCPESRAWPLIACGYKEERKAELTHLDQGGWLGTYFQSKSH